MSAPSATHLFHSSRSIKSIPRDVRRAIRRLDKTKVNQMRDEFLVSDINGDGVISQDEFQKFMDKESIPSDEIDMILAALDVDKSGNIDFAEFLAILVADEEGDPKRLSEREIDVLFDMIDRNGDGKVSKGELKTGIATVGMTVSDEEINLMWQFSGARLGDLNRAQFTDALQKLSQFVEG